MTSDHAAINSDRAVPVSWLAGLGVLALGLVVSSWFRPLWVARLDAPQYPGGLAMRVYGTHVTGDVDEISSLNHYVGMRPFDLADFPEMALWPWAIAGALVAAVLALMLRRRVVRLVGLTYLWGFPLGVLAIIQLRLYQYGHDLDPAAALRIEPFTPWVVGPTAVWNFNTWSWPGSGILALLLAAAIVTCGPRLLRRGFRRNANDRVLAMAVLLGAVLLVTLLPVDPAIAEPASHVGLEHVTQASDLTAFIARAGPGERVVIPGGTYHGPVVIDNPVTLEPRGYVEIVGDGTGTVLTIRAPGTVVQGVTVRGSGPGPTGNPAAIRVEADHVTVSGVTVRDSYIGIAVESADGVRLVDNTIIGRAGGRFIDEGHAVDHEPAVRATWNPAPAATSPHRNDEYAAEHVSGPSDTGHLARGDGIWLHDVNGVLVRGSDIQHARDGVYVSFGSHVLVDSNTVSNGRYAIHTMYATDLTVVENHLHGNLSGAVLMYRGPVLLLRNLVERNRSESTGFGILLKDVVGVEAIENVVIDNRVGVHLEGRGDDSSPNRLIMNTVARNEAGLSAYPSAEAIFRANSFVQNTIQVVDRGGRLDNLVWIDRGLGNYWSSYRGYESTQPGRGAVAHVEGGTVDRLLTRNPELVLLADTPALRMLRTVEERWGSRDPVVTDTLPLTQPLSPAVPSMTSAPVATTTTVGVGLGLLALPTLLLLIGRRQRERRVRRAVHV